MTSQQKIGSLGERIALNYLQRKGYRFLDKNFKYSVLGEIDLIVEKNKIVHFVEVKTRKKGFGYPEEAVNRKKIEKIYQVIPVYLRKISQFKEAQLDVISIELDYQQQIAHLEHIKNFS